MLEHEWEDIMNESHARAVRGNFQANTTTKKVIQVGMWWLTFHKDYQDHVKKNDSCHRLGRPLWKNEIPISSINSNRSFEI
jgi:hypothetical protein